MCDMECPYAILIRDGYICQSSVKELQESRDKHEEWEIVENVCWLIKDLATCFVRCVQK
jgi:hypothetical protein